MDLRPTPDTILTCVLGAPALLGDQHLGRLALTHPNPTRGHMDILSVILFLIMLGIIYALKG